MDAKLEKQLISTLRFHARGLEIPAGSAEVFIERTVKAVGAALRHKKIITSDDFTRTVVRELQKYHADLAYVYENYDTII